MNIPLVQKIANAVLYEGYLLYPYRASALKNRQRWNFGVVYPHASSEMREGIEPYLMETQCLVQGDGASEIAVRVRCLRLVEGSGQDVRECEIDIPPARLAALAEAPDRTRFAALDPLECWIDTSVERQQEGLFRLAVRITNLTPYVAAPDAGREAVLASSLLSAHTILQVRGGEFISLLEPPPQYQDAAAACKNVGTWPVLAGEEGNRDTMLSSPIILYDYPQIAPESPGDLFDSAEIDEILSLRILTLTDEEKSALRTGDERARGILERTEALPPEHFMKLHGVLRGLRPAAEEAQ